jgi:hypothetical protein
MTEQLLRKGEPLKWLLSIQVVVIDSADHNFSLDLIIYAGNSFQETSARQSRTCSVGFCPGL